MDVTYSTHINYATSQAKEALNKCYRIENNIEERIDKKIDSQINKQNDYIITFLKSNNHSLGYKNRYRINIFKEMKNNFSIISLKIIFTYMIEQHIFLNNKYFFYYNFFVDKHKLYLDIFHNNKNYLTMISNNFTVSINNLLGKIHESVKNSFIDLDNTPLRIKLEKLQQLMPSFIDITVAILEEEKKIKDSKYIIDTIIKLLYINLINFEVIFSLKFVSKSNQNDAIKYICEYSTLFDDEIKNNIYKNEEEDNFRILGSDKESLFNNINNINDKIQELFWHQGKENYPFKKKIHFLAFIFIIYFLLFPLSKIINKFIDQSKNSKILDDLLDMPTDNISDITQTLNKNQKKNNSQNKNTIFTKLNTIIEESENDEKTEKIDNKVKKNKTEEVNKNKNDWFQKENINYITRNIISDYNNLNKLETKKGCDIVDIEERLRNILEETTT